MEQIFGEDDPDLEAVCNSFTEGVDLYEYRYNCWDDNGEFVSDDEQCQDTLSKLNDRYFCHIDAKIYNGNFCEAEVLSETNYGEPTFELFEACLQKIKYFDYTIDDLCDYVYP